MLVIRTNNVPRDVVDWEQLTEKEQKEFVWVKRRSEEEQDAILDFVRYKGDVYCISEFLATASLVGRDDESELMKWDGYQSETIWSGKLVKYCDGDRDKVIMGWYYEKSDPDPL